MRGGGFFIYFLKPHTFDQCACGITCKLNYKNAISFINDEELQIQAELHGISHTYIERKVLEAPLLRTTYCCSDGSSTICRSRL